MFLSNQSTDNLFMSCSFKVVFKITQECLLNLLLSYSGDGCVTDSFCMRAVWFGKSQLSLCPIYIIYISFWDTYSRCIIFSIKCKYKSFDVKQTPQSKSKLFFHEHFFYGWSVSHVSFHTFGIRPHIYCQTLQT